jgi:hypothetical protein
VCLFVNHPAKHYHMLRRWHSRKRVCEHIPQPLCGEICSLLLDVGLKYVEEGVSLKVKKGFIHHLISRWDQEHHTIQIGDESQFNPQIGDDLYLITSLSKRGKDALYFPSLSHGVSPSL